MASLIPGDKIKGRVPRKLEFESLAGGRRERLFLGPITLRDGHDFRQRIEHVLADRRLNRAHEKTLCDWLTGLPRPMQLKLHGKGLMHNVASQATTLHQFLADHFAAMNHLKPETRLMYGHTRRNLETFFTPDRLIGTIGSDDGERFRLHLLAVKSKSGRPLAKATVAKRVNMARQFFKAACKLKLLTENPFADVQGGSQRNAARLENVSRETVAQVLTVCPPEWQLLILLARYGGLRIPSEVRKLTWEHVNFDAESILVHCLKTEHHEGHETRLVPIFSEIRPALLAAYNVRSCPHVITSAKLRNSRNLRQQLVRYINQAGLEPWGKPWQNMRSTRQTELTQLMGAKDACAIIGNSERVAMAHYVQVRPGFIQEAIRLEDQARNQAHKQAAAVGNERKDVDKTLLGTHENAEKITPIPFVSGIGADNQWERQDSNL